jgi:glutamine amidotransferase
VITIVDYGLGNVAAFANMYKRLNIAASVAHTEADLVGATHLILPGVGAFDHAIEMLGASGLRDPLDRLVSAGEVRVLGVCVGMQILADSSDEGKQRGLGWIGGSVRALACDPAAAALPLPHMGWNDVQPVEPTPLLKGMEDQARFYFLHSYFFQCERPCNVVAEAEYGVRFACVVRRGNVYGVQFHPEKSHHWGVNLLRNFAEI